MSSPKNPLLLRWEVVAPTAGGAPLPQSCLLRKSLLGALEASSILPFASARKGSSSSREGKSNRAGPECEVLSSLSYTMGKSSDRRRASFWRSSALLGVAVGLLIVADVIGISAGFFHWEICVFEKIYSILRN